MSVSKAARIVLAALLVALAIAGATHARRRSAKRELGTLVLYGNVDIRQVQLAFHSTGRIVKLHAQEGDQVTAGQLLGEVEPGRFEAAAARAEAQLLARREVLARLRAGSRPEEIAEAEARVTAGAARLADAELRLHRTQELARQSFASQQQADEAQTAVATARAELDAVRQAAAVVRQGPRTEDVAAAQAELAASEAALALARRELADTRLHAPVDGILQTRILEPGDMAFPQTPVYTLALGDPVWVRVYVAEPDLGKIAPGMPAMVTTDSFPNQPYEGRIGYISPAAEFTPKQIETADLRTRLVYQVRVFVKNPRNELRLGMPATVRIALPPSRPARNGAAREE